MDETFLYRFTPWAQIDELCMVYRCIYDSIRIEGDGENALIERNFINTCDTLNNLNFAHERVCDWKIRCANLSRPQSIQQHLIAMESMINILLEEYKMLTATGTANNCSLLYSLCSIGVINFCNVLSSYSEQNQTASTRNLARILKCPQWIVECRNDLSHPCGNPPSMQMLVNAISFGLKWMDENFWQKWIAELRSMTKTASTAAAMEPMLRQRLQNEERRQIQQDICLLMFSNILGKFELIRMKKIYNDVGRFMYHNPNEFIGILSRVLVFKVAEKVPELPDNKLPGRLIGRVAKILKIVFSIAPEHSLFLLFNLLVDIIEDMCRGKLKMPNVEIKHCINVGYLWLDLISHSLVKVEKTTNFENCFQFFELDKLKYRYQFTWKRLFFKIICLKPHPILIETIDCLYQLVDHLITRSTFEKVRNSMMTSEETAANILFKSTENSQLYIDGDDDGINWNRFFMGVDVKPARCPENLAAATVPAEKLTKPNGTAEPEIIQIDDD